MRHLSGPKLLMRDSDHPGRTDPQNGKGNPNASEHQYLVQNSPLTTWHPTKDLPAAPSRRFCSTTSRSEAGDVRKASATASTDSCQNIPDSRSDGVRREPGGDPLAAAPTLRAVGNHAAAAVDVT